jgi:hypothetical protein
MSEEGYKSGSTNDIVCIVFVRKKVIRVGNKIDHLFYSLKSLASLSIDTLGPLPVDDDGNQYIVVIRISSITSARCWSLSN